MVKWDVLDEVVADVAELSARQVARPVNINGRGELSDRELAVLDAVGHFPHDLENELDV